jgi:hypothetical protein
MGDRSNKKQKKGGGGGRYGLGATALGLGFQGSTRLAALNPRKKNPKGLIPFLGAKAQRTGLGCEWLDCCYS